MAAGPQVSRELLLGALHALPEIVEICDLDGRLVHVNQAFVDRTGLARDAAVGRRLADILCWKQHQAQLEEALATAAAGAVWRGRLIARTPEGASLVQDAIVAPIRDGGGAITHLVALGRDLQSQDSLAEQLDRTGRLAAVGRLASGVAHEINNPLSYVLGNLAFVTEELERHGSALPAAAREDLRAAIGDIHHGALRVRDIVQDLGAFARSDADAAGPIDVQSVLDSTVKLLGNELVHRAQLVRDYAPVPPVWANGSRLGQALLDLLLNAVDALPVGAARDNEVRVTVRPGEGGVVTVAIRDSGRGIAADDLPHIFDPFFSTKPVGSGTGLGLSIAHALIVDLGGSIAVRSEVGAGTTVTVRLPSQPKVEVAPARVEASEEGRAGARILVVDDQSAVLRTIQRVLGGHEVVTCDSGAAALAALRAGAFDLVFCDVMMPEMTGEQLFHEIVREQPDLRDRFVFLTGGAFTDAAESFLGSVENEVVQKPFVARDLRALVSRLVGS